MPFLGREEESKELFGAVWSIKCAAFSVKFGIIWMH